MIKKSLSHSLLLCLLLLLCIALFACSHSRRPALNNSLKPSARSALAQAQMGLQYLHLGYTDKAQEKLQIALQEDPRNPLVLDAIGYYYEKTGDLQQADRYYRLAIKLDRRSGTVLNNYGAFLCRNGFYQKSIIYFNKAARTPYYSNAREAITNAQFCHQKMQSTLGARPA